MTLPMSAKKHKKTVEVINNKVQYTHDVVIAFNLMSQCIIGHKIVKSIENTQM